MIDTCETRFARIYGNRKKKYLNYYKGCGAYLQLKFPPHGCITAARTLEMFSWLQRRARADNTSNGGCSMKILVVDDEKLLVKGIKFNLENEGYTVDAAYDGEEAVEMARTGDYQLILLDLMMPKKDGLQVCQEIRSFSMVPIIMLTARGERADLLLGFESGADDYVTKPFDILELKARVRALLRRAAVSAPESAATLEYGPIRLDEERRSAWRDGVSVELTMKEFDLIAFLMKNPGKVFSRENLLDLVWGYDYQGDTRTVDVHIRRLREKLEPDPANPRCIITKWGVGYYFAD